LLGVNEEGDGKENEDGHCHPLEGDALLHPQGPVTATTRQLYGNYMASTNTTISVVKIFH